MIMNGCEAEEAEVVPTIFLFLLTHLGRAQQIQGEKQVGQRPNRRPARRVQRLQCEEGKREEKTSKVEHSDTLH